MKTSLAQLMAACKPASIPANVRHEFDIWQEGFDAITRHETTGEIPMCPYLARPEQARLWYQGTAASRRMTQLAEELEKYERD